MKYFWQFTILLKRVAIFLVPLVVIFWIYTNLIPDVWRRGHILFSIVIAWLVTAYLLLPRLHRLLSRIYVPDHFIGRSRTADGLLSDPVNLAVNGDKNELIKAMESAGWVQAEPLNFKSAWRAAWANVLRQSYPNAPVSAAFLFGEPHDLAFQKEVDNNPRERHHVRFWRTPRSWFLPGGRKVDWLGAATYDGAVGFSFFTSQFTHKIDAKVDKERDFLVRSLERANRTEKTEKIEHFFPKYKSRNGFGHHFVTDGSFVIADLTRTK